MQFDIRNFLQSAKTPYTTQFSADLSAADWDGFRVPDPLECAFTAHPTQEGAMMTLHVKASIEAECARCLAPVHESYDFTREYLVRMRDLDDIDFELPLDDQGQLDLRELAYQELIFEVPRVLLCSPDCQGLCPICGKRKAEGCACQVAAEAAPVDARLSILKQLLS